ncbi:hypothetical protein [Sorangium sp. So ce542]|uniref:hypothetical protein n=1 Tax=Sorangium sp. So ce542 TaxID=3133316 RepID=UPI003F5F7F1C
MRLISLSLLVASMAAGYTTTASEHHKAESTAAPSSPSIHSDEPHTSILPGHQRTALSLELVPTELISNGGSQTLSIDIEAHNTTSSAISTSIAYEVVSDQGTVITPAVVDASSQLAQAASDVSTATTPAGLSDGYYFVRATGAWSSNSTFGTTSAYLYFVVKSGKLSVVDETDWHSLSRAKEGYIQ